MSRDQVQHIVAVGHIGPVCAHKMAQNVSSQ
jgi:hypothetical protein